jgi:hypothetical protein
MLGASWLWSTFIRTPDIPEDGFGQSLADDVRFAVRFRRCRNAAASWRRADRETDAQYERHPIIGRFGDSTVATAAVEGRTWIARERDWYGWPDPPRYAFFALGPDGTIWAAADFHQWPVGWTIDRDPELSSK